MKNDDLDHILKSDEDDILPSSGFVASVMGAVRSEAVTPPPIPFPWKRALPGLAATALVLGWVLVVAVMQYSAGANAPALDMALPSTLVSLLHAATWIALALLLSYVVVRLSMRLVSGRT